MNNQENNKPKTVTDRDGNMQVRSSGRTPARTPMRTPARTPARAPQTKPAAPKKPTPEAPKDTGREYSFATSALFNNDPKNRKTDATAVSEAKKVTGVTPTPSTGTKVINTARPHHAPRRNMGAASVRPTQSGAPIPPASGRPPQSGSPMPPASGRPPQSGAPMPPQGRPPQRAVEGRPQRPPVAPPQQDPSMPPVRQPQGTPPMPNMPLQGTNRPKVSSATRVSPAVKEEILGRPRRAMRKTPEEEGKTAKNKVISSFSAMNSLTKSLIYIACVMVVSIILSVVIITNANDIFAFVKDEKTVSLEIAPGTDLDDLAEMLKDEGIIEHKNTFKFFIKFRNKASDSYSPGTYTVSSTMSYDQIISAITPRIEREMIRITVPEGYSVDEIIDLFVEKGIGEREKYVDVINNGDFSGYWFVNELPEDPNRYYRLEGYLFPDTYYFYTDMSEDTVIRKFLDNFESKLTKKYREAIAASINPMTDKPYTVDEIVTLASIIQAEGKERSVVLTSEDGKSSGNYIDYGLISGVFFNRMSLGNPMRLQSDVTTAYALMTEGKADAKLSDYTNPEYTNPYNTYAHKGLPPGAVCNPGLNAISFAMEPDRLTGEHYFLYFCADAKGNTHFFKTEEEHNAFVAKLKQEAGVE